MMTNCFTRWTVSLWCICICSVTARAQNTPSPLQLSSAEQVETLATANSVLDVSEGVVSSAGSLQYRIPIAIPKGRGGVQPSLGLAYDSDGHNDFAGIGWT